MNKSTIEWTDKRWNPVRGCSRVSEGCRNCYAESIAARFSGPGKPFAGFAERTKAGPRWTGKVALIPEKLAEPLSWRKPARVFVNSMSDLFHEGLDFEAVAAVFGVMAACPHLTFQVLTKRPARAAEFFASISAEGNICGDHADVMMAAWIAFGDDSPGLAAWERSTGSYEGAWPLANVWLGVSVEDQATADERIPLLLQCPAAVRFVSYEPALGPIDFRRVHYDNTVEIDSLTGDHGVIRPLRGRSEAKLGWLIIGGESGPHARPFDIAWARSTIAQCRAAGMPVFVKQLGAQAILDPRYDRLLPGATRKLRDRKGGDMAEWPEDLCIREFPQHLPANGQEKT